MSGQSCPSLLPVLRAHRTSLHSSAEAWIRSTDCRGTTLGSLGRAARAAGQPRGHQQVWAD